MAKNKTPKRNGFNTQKIFKYVRIGALALPAVQTIISPMAPQHKISQITSDYFGINPTTRGFELPRLAKGWMPFLASVAITYGIPKLAGMIRRL